MTNDEINAAIAELLGITPKRMWRVWYDAERQHGSIRIPTRSEAVDRASHEIEYSKRMGYELVVSDPEEYDEWQDIPNYHGSLDACATFEATLNPSIEHEMDGSGHVWNEYVNMLDEICARTGDTCVAATAAQRCEAFLRVKGKWIE